MDSFNPKSLQISARTVINKNVNRKDICLLPLPTSIKIDCLQSLIEQQQKQLNKFMVANDRLLNLLKSILKNSFRRNLFYCDFKTFSKQCKNELRCNMRLFEEEIDSDSSCHTFTFEDFNNLESSNKGNTFDCYDICLLPLPTSIQIVCLQDLIEQQQKQLNDMRAANNRLSNYVKKFTEYNFYNAETYIIMKQQCRKELGIDTYIFEEENDSDSDWDNPGYLWSSENDSDSDLESSNESPQDHFWSSVTNSNSDSDSDLESSNPFIHEYLYLRSFCEYKSESEFLNDVFEYSDSD